MADSYDVVDKKKTGCVFIRHGALPGNRWLLDHVCREEVYFFFFHASQDAFHASSQTSGHNTLIPNRLSDWDKEKEIVMTDTWVFAGCYCFPCCLKSSSSPVWLPAGKATSLTRMSYLLLVVQRVTSPWKMGVKWHFDFELDVTFPFHFSPPKTNPVSVVCCNTKTQMLELVCSNCVSSLSTWIKM